MKKQKFDAIYSIGYNCPSSMYLKKAHLRGYSGPFDWLINADFETRIKLILNNFKDFLDPKDMAPLAKDPNMFNDKKCDYYQNLRNGFYFFHDFPIGIPFERVFPEVVARYDRRIKRFYQNINKANTVLLVWFSHQHNTPDNVLFDASNRICAKFGKQIDFLVIEHTENLKQPQKRVIAKNIVRYNLHTKLINSDGKETVMGDEKRVLPIFEQYKLNLPLHTRFIIYSRRIVSDILCLFLPFKKLRRKIKKIVRGHS